MRTAPAPSHHYKCPPTAPLSPDQDVGTQEVFLQARAQEEAVIHLHTRPTFRPLVGRSVSRPASLRPSFELPRQLTISIKNSQQNHTSRKYLLNIKDFPVVLVYVVCVCAETWLESPGGVKWVRLWCEGHWVYTGDPQRRALTWRQNGWYYSRLESHKYLRPPLVLSTLL